MIVLDTDVLTMIQRARGAEYSRLIAYLKTRPPQPICVTIITFEEQMRGWLAFIARAKNPDRQIQGYARLRELLVDFQTRPVLDYDDRALREYERLVRGRIRIGTMDLRIAAIALSRDATLLTRNMSDFRKIAGLKLDSWTDAEPV